MRWNSKPEPRTWDTRQRTAFLWVPMWIGRQGRWLERATWEETCCSGIFSNFWAATSWVDDPDRPIPYTVTQAGRDALSDGGE